MQLQLPKRPVLDKAVQMGSIGTQIRLISNLFPLKLENTSSSSSDEPHNTSEQRTYQANNTKCFQYSIDFEPEVEPSNRTLRMQIFKKSKPNLEKIIGKFCFSGQCIFTLKKVNRDNLQKIEDPRTTEPVLVGNINYSTRIRFVKELDVNEDEANQEGQLIQKKGNQVTQILNVILKSILREERFTEIGKNSKFFEDQYSTVQFVENGFNNILEVYKGLQFGVHPAAGKLFLMVDFASRILRQETALDFLRGSSQGQYGSIVGESVSTKYNNQQIYRIDGIDRSKNPTSTFFWQKKNQHVSFVDYYREQYKVQIRDLNQPLLLHLRKYREPNTNVQKIEDVFLVPELCHMTGLTDEMRKNFRMMKELSNHTKLEPKDRFEISQNYGKLLAQKSRSSGVRIDVSNSTVNATQLRPPTIRFGLNQSMTPHDANYNFKNPIYDRTEFKEWSLIYPENLGQDVLRFVDDLTRYSQTYGITVHEPFLFATQSTNFEEWKNLLDQDFIANDLPSFVLSFSKPNNALYSKLKKFLYLEAGIEHQHLNATSLHKNSASVISKIALQIAAKMGKRLWQVEIPKGISTNTMIIGIETSMKRIRENNQMRQVVGVVASITRDMATYYSEVEIRNETDTQLPTLSKIIKSALNAYFKKNNELVEEVIIYRQGVGEGQVMQSLQHEIKAVQSGFESFKKGYKPRFAFFQVNKKIGQKFYQEQRGKLVNPTSGSVLAEGIVGDNFEFYLCAQNCNSGVCTPTKYTCLYNDTYINEPTFWQLTYFQCYNYYNWQGPVRVPAAMMYAGKLSKFTSEVLGQKALNDLVNSLYYL